MRVSSEHLSCTMLISQTFVHRAYFTAGNFAGAAALLVILRFLINWNLARQRLKKAGRKAPLVACKLPFGRVSTEQIPSSNFWGLIADSGIDLFAEAVNRLFKNDFFNWSRELLDDPGRLVALKMMGAEVLMTDGTDNIRTILSTGVCASEGHIEFIQTQLIEQFSDWGKGDALRKIWYDLMLDSIFTCMAPTFSRQNLKLINELKSRWAPMASKQGFFARPCKPLSVPKFSGSCVSNDVADG